ncbi:hypothetical protein THMIRHAS_04910 [Thiosulfatimonas sediminis]|uniref:Uncharacterized protein n=1 Tax=Thiosulfatimonas sediminis TaxID=2675054 RepID=A0A6F8PSX3_9GAMM|nr:hypothetical protein [Thiosulfatimonas sediminis]BBP45118.1 hypothetical protein THMIRHAS_04910 [Thiosulfatimonas sediminis]
MTNIEQIHQRVRTALLRGEALASLEREQAFEAISLIDTRVEKTLLDIGYSCDGLDSSDAELFQEKVIDLTRQHLMLSDLTFWLKTQVPQGGAHD